VTQTNFSKAPNIDAIIDDLKVTINEEKMKQDEIDRHVADFQKKIIEKRHALGGYNAGAENESALQKQIKILENRLDKANQKFNEAIAINKQLRQSIDSLRRERVIFDNLYKKLEKELHEKRKVGEDLFIKLKKGNGGYHRDSEHRL
jgi:chromosome segregation ATPase